MRQHLVQIVENVLKKFALRAGLNCGKQKIAEGAAIFQKENGEQRNYEEQPRLLGHVGGAQSDVLGELGDLVAVTGEK